jgi:DNA-binding CsgD family transcriptional regulator
MPDLAAKDLRAVLDAVYAFNDDQDGDEMPAQVLASLASLVGCELISYSYADPISQRLLSTTVQPADKDISGLPGFRAVIDQHPGFDAYRSGRLASGASVAWSDLANLRMLGRLALYVDFYRPHGLNDDLMCMVQPSRQWMAVLGFYRGRRGFSHRDRAVTDLVTLHLAQAVARRRRLVSLTAAVRSLGRRTERVEQALPRLSTLTAREREVVEHLVGGVTDREIARSLAVSQRTVHKHLERVYRKLDVANRTSLIAMVHQTK